MRGTSVALLAKKYGSKYLPRRNTLAFLSRVAMTEKVHITLTPSYKIT
jgi:hypothetical protein